MSCGSAGGAAVLVGITTVLTAACERAERVVIETVQRRDSAGIEIVENLIDPAVLPVWTLDSVPLVEIGGHSGNPPAEFGAIGTALRLSDGTLVVSDEQAAEIRFFRSDGTHLRTVGRRGGGPGEFRSLIWMYRFASDSLVAWDGLALRATVFSAAGDVVRIVNPSFPENLWPDGRPGPGYRLDPFLPARDGGWLSLARPLPQKPPWLEVPGYYSHPMRILRHEEDGTIRGTIATTPGPVITFLRDRQFAAIGAVRSLVILRRDDLVIGERTGTELRIHSLDGELTRLIRFERTYDWMVRTPEAVEATIDTMMLAMRANPSLRARYDEGFVRAFFDPPYLRDQPTRFTGLEADAEGRIWVREQRPIDQPSRWIVFGEDGVARAFVEIPRSLSVTDRGGDYVVAVRRDDMDVQYVGIWRLMDRFER